MKLKGKTAIVTGSGRGIGRATAILLSRHGANIVVTSRNEKEMAETLREVKKHSDGIAVKCDVRSMEDAKNLAASAIKKFGRVDILVNNAGVAYYEPFAKMGDEKVRDTIDTNLHGVFNVTHAVLKGMKKGVIINISSGAGKHGIGGLAVYCASKFGVLGFTESLAMELKNVKVYAVCPGGVDTKMYSSLFGRRGALKPEEVAEKVLVLCAGAAPSGASVDVRK